jgi:sugar/nucleoside kinase (ribokinase family)
LTREVPVGLFVGLATLDLVFRVQGYPRQNSKNIVSEKGLYAGGPAANAAVAFAAMGGAARLETAIGGHPLGAVIRADLNAHGVRVLDRLPDFDGLPPLASVLVSNPGGDRTAVSSASTGLPEVPSNPADFEPAPGVVLIDAHLFEMCLTAARMARARGIPVVLDGGSWKNGMDEILDEVDYAICSEHFFPPGCATPHETLADLKARGVPYRAVTRGERPIQWEGPEGAGEVAVESIEAVDTLGAGDFFHGGFCHALASGAGLEAALHVGARVATLSCKSFGTRAWLSQLAQAFGTM